MVAKSWSTKGAICGSPTARAASTSWSFSPPILDWIREDVAVLTKRMQKLWIVQKSLQPQGNLNVGCIFQDVGGIRAASLIEQAGFKSAQVGQASISDLNANFIVAQPQAKSRDVIELIERLRNGVAERLGIALEAELEIW